MYHRYHVRKSPQDGTFEVRGPGMAAQSTFGYAAKFTTPEHASLVSALCEAAFDAGRRAVIAGNEAKVAAGAEDPTGPIPAKGTTVVISGDA